MSALPGRWLAPGRATVVHDAPTKRGAVDVSLRPVRRGALLRWNAAVADGTPLWWRVRASARDVRAAGLRVLSASALRLPGRAGELRIAWRVPVRTSSFDGVTAALQKAYRQRGAKPPV